MIRLTRTYILALVALAATPLLTHCGTTVPGATPDGGPLQQQDAGVLPDGGNPDSGTPMDGGVTASLTSLEISPTSPTVAKGTVLQLRATAVYSDGSVADVTETTTWSSSKETVATVSDASGTRGQVQAISAGSADITVRSADVEAHVTVTVTDATLSAIAVSPGNANVANGTNQQFTAIGIFSDATTQDVTLTVDWSSSNPGVASISNASGTRGLASALSVGQTSISAKLGAVTGSTSLVVSQANVTAIAVTPAHASLVVGMTLQFSAVATFSDGTTQDVTQLANFASSDITAATISNSFARKGEATGVAAGTTTISAKWNGATGSASLSVVQGSLTSIAVTPANPSVPAGFQFAFTATGTWSNGMTQDLTTQVTWVTSNPNVASISNAGGSRGRAEAVLAGTTTVTASMGSISGSTNLTVTNATLSSMSVAPATLSLSTGQSGQLTANGTFSDGSQLDVTRQANWTSSKPNVVVVVNAGAQKGMLFAGSTGTATVTALLNGKSAASQVTVK